jgi:hypothetical protein
VSQLYIVFAYLARSLWSALRLGLALAANMLSSILPSSLLNLERFARVRCSKSLKLLHVERMLQSARS